MADSLANNDIIMPLAIFLIAAIYSSIGQGGATGYLALMAVGRITSSQMRPTALALNILVSALAGFKFYRAGHFSRSVFWPATLAGAPMAMIGASIDLPEAIYKTMVALVLLYAAARLLQSSVPTSPFVAPARNPAPLPAAFAGGLIGLISGLTGNGGGIFLSPIMLLAHWSDGKSAAGTSALYTLVNSVAGLMVVSQRVEQFPLNLPIWLAAAGIGAWVGSEFGLKGLSERTMQQLLACALAIAALRSLIAVVI